MKRRQKYYNELNYFGQATTELQHELLIVTHGACRMPACALRCAAIQRL